MTQTLSSFVLIAILATPSLAVAQERQEQAEGILASAERSATGIALQQTELGTRKSPTRLAIGLGMAGAGIAMLLIDPEQPIQPGVVSDNRLTDASVAQFAGLTAFDVITLRLAADQPVLVCEPFCPGDIDSAILGSFITGAASGIVATTLTIEEQNWQLYDGPIQPFEERSNGLKFGGAALVAGGAIIAGLFSDVPVLNRVAFAPTDGGVNLSTSFGF